jgi:hypothetical protein
MNIFLYNKDLKIDIFIKIFYKALATSDIFIVAKRQNT